MSPSTATPPPPLFSVFLPHPSRINCRRLGLLFPDKCLQITPRVDLLGPPTFFCYLWEPPYAFFFVFLMNCFRLCHFLVKHLFKVVFFCLGSVFFPVINYSRSLVLYGPTRFPPPFLTPSFPLLFLLAYPPLFISFRAAPPPSTYFNSSLSSYGAGTGKFFYLSHLPIRGKIFFSKRDAVPLGARHTFHFDTFCVPHHLSFLGLFCETRIHYGLSPPRLYPSFPPRLPWGWLLMPCAPHPRPRTSSFLVVILFQNKDIHFRKYSFFKIVPGHDFQSQSFNPPPFFFSLSRRNFLSYPPLFHPPPRALLPPDSSIPGDIWFSCPFSPPENQKVSL